MKILETERLRLRTINPDDAAFYYQLVNDPTWLEHIGDKGIRSVEQARTALIEEIQEKVAADLSTVPYLQGAQVAVVGSDVEGTEDTLDASFKFRYGAISKG